MEDQSTTEAVRVLLDCGPLKPGPYRYLGQVEEAHKGHWFDEGAKRFFSSRTGDSTYSGRFFVSSEASGFAGSSRGYTVRMAHGPEASIDDVAPEGLKDGFQAFDSGAAARRFAEGLKDQRVTVRELEGRPVVYVGECIAGSRYYDAAGALELADELTGRRGRLAQYQRLAALDCAANCLRDVDGLDTVRASLRRRADRIRARLSNVLGLEA